MTSPALVWFRQDLRLDDNPALAAAVDRGGPVVPVFIRAADEDGVWRAGEASDWWLHQSLQSLGRVLADRGSRLVLRTGSSLPELSRLAAETGATAVFWNRRYDPAPVARDQQVKSELLRAGLEAESFPGNLLFEPWQIKTRTGQPYQVFTPFWRALLEKPQLADPLPVPERIPAPPAWPASLSLESLQLESNHPWAGGLRSTWQPGSAEGTRRLAAFLNDRLETYDTARNLPAETGTSRLSPYLHFGEISPRTIWRAVNKKLNRPGEQPGGASTYLKELAWREFAHHLLFHFPTTPDQPLRSEFRRFPWQDDPAALRAWQRGKTGYPIVDAGMRELWQTGWMHNRVRMIVASFLVKDLRLDWRHGAAWFWDTLVDADLANNTLGWQWSAGCGADAAPYFRVFNPVLQSEKFDPGGHYLRRWLPELKSLPLKWLHAPWTAPQDQLNSAGIELGNTYPVPLVDHANARILALNAFEQIKSG